MSVIGVPPPGSRAGSALLDRLAGLADLDDALHEDARGVDVLGVEFAGFDELLDLGDRDPAGHGAQRVEVARRRVVDEVAVPVAAGRADEREVGDDPVLQHVVPAAELADLLRRRGDRDRAVGVVAPRQPTVGDQGADAGRGVERRDARAAGPQPLGQRALRASARPRARRRGTAARTPCSRRRRSRSCGGSARRRAACRAPRRRRRSCSTRSRARSRPGRAAPRSGRSGCRTARTRRRPATPRRGCRRPPRRADATVLSTPRR